MVYSTGGSNIGGNNYIRWQEQPYGDWSEATVTRAQDEYHTNKNAEIIELKDGRLMMHGCIEQTTKTHRDQAR